MVLRKQGEMTALVLRRHFDVLLKQKDLRKERLYNLFPFYAKPLPVTPRFLGNIIGKQQGFYKVDGVLSILYRKFEDYWHENCQSDLRYSKGRDFDVLLLHIGNIRALSRSSYIDTNNAIESLQEFVAELDRTLWKFPHSESGLRSALTCRQIGDIPLDDFIPQPGDDPGRYKKFQAFEQFVFTS